MHGICMQSLKHVKWRAAAGIIALGLFLGGGALYSNMARTATTPLGISTPTSFVVTLNKAEIQQNIGGDFNTLISDQPGTIDVIANTGKTTAKFTSGTAPFNTYNGVRLTLAADATYSGIDPCTGNPVSDAAIRLPDAVNDQYVLQYEVPHPIRGLPAGAVSYQPFTIAATNKTTPMEFRIVFPVSNSIACVANNPPSQDITGPNTAISTSYGMYIDSTNSEIAVTNSDPNNSATNSINFYGLADNGDVLPRRVIQGADTMLNQPWGIAIANDEVFVTNSNDDKILVFSRTDAGNTAPKRIIANPPVDVNGNPTCGDYCLDGPGGIYVDTTHSEIGVVNGGAEDSISFYNLTDTGTPTPLRTIKGPGTGLSTPCGIAFYADPNNVPANDEIIVANNGNNSITIYPRPTDIGGGVLNTSPTRTIQGPHTGLSKICNVTVDPNNDEIAVANSGTGSVTFYKRTDNGNVYPIRTMKGSDTGITLPVGLALDPANNELGITDVSTQSVIMHTRSDPRSSEPYGAVATPLRVPVLFTPAIQQNLYASYVFSGNLDKATGTPLMDNTSTPPEYVHYYGYGINWKITDPNLRQPADAVSAALIPPSAVTFTLADGTSASNLQLGCASFTPFIIDVLTTACKTQPLIVSPNPPVDDIYRVGAELLAKTIVQKIHLNIPPLEIAEWPRLVPTMKLTANKSILGITWVYVDGNGDSLDVPGANKPLIYNQTISINGTRSYSEISSCYTQASGNAQTLIFSSASLGPDDRNITDVKNNSCDISLDDIATITFTTSDAFGNKYVFTWSPS